MARARCGARCRRVRPTNAPRASGSQIGERSPARYGRKRSPSAPGATSAASAIDVSACGPPPRTSSRYHSKRLPGRGHRPTDDPPLGERRRCYPRVRAPRSARRHTPPARRRCRQCRLRLRPRGAPRHGSWQTSRPSRPGPGSPRKAKLAGDGGAEEAHLLPDPDDRRQASCRQAGAIQQAGTHRRLAGRLSPHRDAGEPQCRRLHVLRYHCVSAATWGSWRSTQRADWEDAKREPRDPGRRFQRARLGGAAAIHQVRAGRVARPDSSMATRVGPWPTQQIASILAPRSRASWRVTSVNPRHEPSTSCSAFPVARSSSSPYAPLAAATSRPSRRWPALHLARPDVHRQDDRLAVAHEGEAAGGWPGPDPIPRAPADGPRPRSQRQMTQAIPARTSA